MYVEVEKNHTVELESKRKKREEGDLSGLVGCTFGTVGLQMVQNTVCFFLLILHIVRNLKVSWF